MKHSKLSVPDVSSSTRDARGNIAAAARFSGDPQRVREGSRKDRISVFSDQISVNFSDFQFCSSRCDIVFTQVMCSLLLKVFLNIMKHSKPSVPGVSSSTNGARGNIAAAARLTEDPRGP